MKTKYSSFNINGLPEGCKFCVKGKKLVLFISGICSRNCYYCSLSDMRKNKDKICANERFCSSVKDAIEEVIGSNATSAGITGGDPLLFLDRTIEYAKALKNKFDKLQKQKKFLKATKTKGFRGKFHIHIYLPTKLVDDKKLKRLSKYIDEVRFNPRITERINLKEKINFEFDIEKIKIAGKYWKKENIGIELPMIPNNKKEFLDFILEIKDNIGFVNLNEFELSETNMRIVTKHNKLNPGGYTIKDSIKSGLWLMNKLKKRKTKLKVHLCTAKLKNDYQFKNRLKLHNILPFGYKTEDGMVKYLAIYSKNKKELLDVSSTLKKNKIFIDNKKLRIILSEDYAEKLLKTKKYSIELVEEFPTFDSIEVEREKL